MSEPPNALVRAIAEWRAAYPEDDDLPDEAIGNLLLVRCRAFGLALTDLGHALVDAARKDWQKLVLLVAACWVLLLLLDQVRPSGR